MHTASMGRLSFSRMLVNRPKTVMAITIAICAVLITISAFYAFIVDTNDMNFRVKSGEIADNYDAFQTAFDKNKRGDMPSDYISPRQVMEMGSLTLIFPSDPSYENILLAPRILEIADMEDKIIQTKDYDNYILRDENGTHIGFFSLTSYFREGGYDGPMKYVNDSMIQQSLLQLPEMSETFMLDKGYCVERLNRSIALRTLFRWGGPIDEYNNIDVDFRDQYNEMRLWAYDLSAVLDKLKYDEFDVLFFGDGAYEYLVDSLLERDGSLAMGSLAFVFFYMWYHLQSLYLAALGSFHAILSFPVAYALYRVVFQRIFVNTLFFLGLFVMTGIACDDIFIMTDAWRQSGLVSSLTTLEQRMSWAYRRASKAMLITTLTTSAAFGANILSSIPQVKDFGVYMSTLVLCNYILVITWFPACIILWHKKKERKRIAREKKFDDASVAEDSARIASSGDVQSAEKLRKIEKMFRDVYAPFVRKYRYIILVVFGIGFVVFAIFTSRLEPSDNPAEMLPPSHPLSRFIEYSNDVFYAHGDLFAVYVHFVFGVEGIDRATSEDPGYVGEPKYYSNFDPSSSELNTWLRAKCVNLTQSPYISRIDNQKGQKDGVVCWAKDFYDWCTDNSITCFDQGPTTFGEAVLKFCKNGDSPYYSQYNEMISVNRVSKKVNWFQIPGQMSIAIDEPEQVARRYYNHFDDKADQWNANRPSGLPELFQTSFIFVWMETEAALLKMAFVGVSVSLAFVFVLTCVATLDVAISTFVTVSIGGVVVCVLGTMWLIGWQIGIVESICAVVLCGLAVDYSLHLGHSYNEATGSRTRYEKVQKALANMLTKWYLVLPIS